MKKIYCLVMHDHDETCGSREFEELHTTNKKRLEALAFKLNKKVNKEHYRFYVREITPKTDLSKEDINKVVEKFSMYTGF